MPKLWKHLNKEETPQIQVYKFAEATEMEPPKEKTENSEEAYIPEPVSRETDPIGFAQIQADKIVEDARHQAEQILENARQQGKLQADVLMEQARKQGYDAGFQEGRQQGTAQAMEEITREKEHMEQELGKRVEAFSHSAERALTHQMNENLEGMRDLAIAVAEKVISVSLRSSADVITKMIQTAVDKQKRREWVHIYISQQDTNHLASLPPALASSLAELSDHVRIIPMADDESGTCIVEFPDQIIDASASTQIQNIKELLNSQHGR